MSGALPSPSEASAPPDPTGLALLPRRLGRFKLILIRSRIDLEQDSILDEDEQAEDSYYRD